jgi:hypothetical protein
MNCHTGIDTKITYCTGYSLAPLLCRMSAGRLPPYDLTHTFNMQAVAALGSKHQAVVYMSSTQQASRAPVSKPMAWSMCFQVAKRVHFSSGAKVCPVQ